MDNYKSNSKKVRNAESRKEPVKDIPEKKVEKIVKGKAVTKKKSWITKLFISDDQTDIKSYIVEDILIPAGKRAVSDVGDALVDVVRNSISMMLYGEEAKTNRSASSRISYRSYYDKRDSRDSRDKRDVRRTNGYSYDDVILETRIEAEEVLTNLEELISMYGMASVADLYDLVGISGAYTDNKYGWTDIRSATSVRVRDGYLLKMPRAIPLN